MKQLAYLNKFFYKYRWRLLLGIIFVSCSNYFRVLQPRIIRHALDLVVDNIGLYRLNDGFASQMEFFNILGKTLLFFWFFGAFTGTNHGSLHVFYAANHYCDVAIDRVRFTEGNFSALRKSQSFILQKK